MSTERGTGFSELQSDDVIQVDAPRSLYMKLFAISLVLGLFAYLIIYFTKPEAFLKEKNNPKSGIDIGMTLLVAVAVFVASMCILYLLHKSFWATR